MSMRPDDKDDRSGNIIRIRGLPWDATKQEICFSDDYDLKCIFKKLT